MTARIAMMLAIPLLLAACASPAEIAAQRQARLDAYVGMSETALVHQLGPPASRQGEGAQSKLVYFTDYSQWWPGSPFDDEPPQLLGLQYHSIPPRLFIWSCETTFDIAAGKVVAAHQRGNYCGGAA